MAPNEKNSLIKFCDIDTSLKILKGQSLRWSSPHLFNDPYELTHNIDLDISKTGFLREMVLEAVEMLFDPVELKESSNNLVATIARWKEEKRFNSADEAESVLRELLEKKADKQYSVLKEHLRQWQKHVSSVRICCFSDEPNNVNAWQRYGDNHHGVALEFACNNGSALQMPKKMTYSVTPPTISSLGNLVNIAFGKEAKLNSRKFIKKSLIKSRKNIGENEWRCFITDVDGSTLDDYLWYSNTKFPVGDLKKVYFGLDISPEDRATVLNVLKNNYQKTQVFKAQKRKDSYEIDFSQVPKL